MSFHPEILKPRQREVLHSLGPAATRHGFYLGGGTAIALHLGHRRSVDFDWFRQPLLEDPLEMARELQEEGIPFVTGWTRRTTLYGTVRGVRVSFFQFRYRLLSPLVPSPEASCELAALEDLACMKLSAISQRGSRKDFVDLFASAAMALRCSRCSAGIERNSRSTTSRISFMPSSTSMMPMPSPGPR